MFLTAKKKEDILWAQQVDYNGQFIDITGGKRNTWQKQNNKLKKIITRWRSEHPEKKRTQ